MEDESRKNDNKWERLRVDLEGCLGATAATSVRDELKKMIVESRNTEAFRGTETTDELWNALTFATRGLSDPHSRVGKSVYKFAQAMRYVHGRLLEAQQETIALLVREPLTTAARRENQVRARELVDAWEKAFDHVLQFIKGELATANGMRKRRDFLFMEYERALEQGDFGKVDSLVMRITVREIRRAREQQETLARDTNIEAILSSVPDEEDSTMNATYGYVYLIKQEGEPLYKIGMTKNLNKRFKSAQTDNPHVLREVHNVRCQDERAAETALHMRFREYGGPFCANRQSLGISERATEWFVFDEATAIDVVSEMDRLQLPDWKRVLLESEWVDEMVQDLSRDNLASESVTVTTDWLKSRVCAKGVPWSASVERMVAERLEGIARYEEGVWHVRLRNKIVECL